MSGKRVQVSRISVLTHSYPDETGRAVRELIEFMAAANVEVLMTPDETSKHGLDIEPPSVEGVTVNASIEATPDLCVVLGGDGTILRALRTYARRNVPVLGVNFGRIGFLATAERDDLVGVAKRTLAGDVDLLGLPALMLDVGGSELVAFNDVGFHRKPKGQVAEVALSLGNYEVNSVRCDGLVAATPAGSTGYNLANGGPILAWGVEGYVVSFIAPHTLTARPLVVAPRDVLHVRNLAAREPIDVTTDGDHICELAPGAELEVRFCNDVGCLAQLPGTNFYDQLKEKFGRLTI